MVIQKFHSTSPRRLAGRVLISSLLLLLCIAFAASQDIRATARVDSNNIMIGDWLGLHIEVQHKDNTVVTWPTITDSLQGFEIVKRGNIETQKNGNDVLEKATYTITAFDSGALVVPPLQFLYGMPGDSAKQMAETSPIPVFVHTVAVDTSKDIKDVKPPLTLPISLAELLPYIIVVLILAGLFWLGYYIWKKKKLGESILPETPPRPAHEVALESLRALESEHLWQRDKIKEYYSQLTDIIRTYIERRFGVMAMEMVTHEIMSSPAVSSLNKEIQSSLQSLLTLSDYVKFAKMLPTKTENEMSMPTAVKFVESTWRIMQHDSEIQSQSQETAEVKA